MKAGETGDGHAATASVAGLRGATDSQNTMSTAGSISMPRSDGAGRAAVACTHCGLGVPAGLIEEGAAQQFCCGGCRTAYDVIHSCGLERYYRLRDETSQREAEPVRPSGRRYAEFDDPVFESLYVRSVGGTAPTLKTVELLLSGVHCAACVWLVERLSAVTPGVVESRLDLRRGLVRVTWDSDAVSLSRIARVLESLGYPPSPARGVAARDARRREDRRHLVRLGVAGACAANVMLLALALYAGAFDGMERAYEQMFRWLSLAISMVALAWPGNVFIRGAIAAIRTLSLHLDLPISIGLVAGAAWGTVNTVRGEGEIYFDSLAVLVFALLVGRYIQHRQQRWAADSVELLFTLTPNSARRVANDVIEDVPVEALSVGDVVEVLAGDSVPVDGVIVQGQSDVDESLLSGESSPVRAAPGFRASAGAVNLSGPIRIRVEATGEDTRVGRLMKLVSDASQKKAGIVRLADRMAGWFIVGSLSLAGITLLLWLWLDRSRAIDHAAALLIVTCPCAVGLATPLAMTVAIGRAARRGILIKGGDALEQLSRPGQMFVDKTGTLTQGRLIAGEWIGDEEIRPLVAALERHSTHPIALALARAAPADASIQVQDVRQELGQGISGSVNGRRVSVGRWEFLGESARGRDEIPCEPPRWTRAFIEQCAAAMLSPVFVAVDGRVVAAVGVGDSLRESSCSAIESLRGDGWGVELLSGDHPSVVMKAGRMLGLAPGACHGGESPEGKLHRVRQALAQGPVVMIGDGVNDAAALSAATVGIAVHGGAEASLAAADIYLNAPGLDSVASLTHAARATMRAIKVCLAVSIGYNAVSATLAMTGHLSPIVAAIMMPVSSLTVLALSLRARTFEPARRSGRTRHREESPTGVAPGRIAPCP
ncbi:MAG: heavy metal translocating P-type ATPase [Phycisphaerales bacterium]